MYMVSARDLVPLNVLVTTSGNFGRIDTQLSKDVATVTTKLLVLIFKINYEYGQ